MIWDRLMALFCRGFGHAIEWDLDGRYCVRCLEAWPYEGNTSNAINRTWKP